MRFIGLDAGSVSVKYVVLDENGNKLNSSYVRHKGHPLKVALEMLKSVTRDALCVMSFKDSHFPLLTSHFQLLISLFPSPALPAGL